MERTKNNEIERTKKPEIERTKKEAPLVTQMRKRVNEDIKEKKELDGQFTGNNTSTGSTLLDLAISGGRVRGGGLPGGVLVEIFGPSGSGKTVLLSEIAGDIQRKGGEVKFHDPEARLNQQFARMFGLELKKGDYYKPDTIPEVFGTVRDWEPSKTKGIIHGIMADSLAALSTDMEMEKKEGDKMGMRRAKEFSEELRKTCRILAQNNFLMVCSNQIRVNVDAGQWAPKYTTPGGEAIAFYSSLRLKTHITKKHKKEISFHSKKVEKIIGIDIEVEVYKNSIWKPYNVAPVTIIFDYGIDDIRQNLQFIKQYSNKTVYTIGNESLDKGMDDSIRIIEDSGREEELKQEVILLWNKIEFQFNSNRKPRR
jgi:protein RecA